MASHRGFLPPSKEIVLEIQLNKFIHDFLFSGSNTSSLRHGHFQGQQAVAWNVGTLSSSLQKKQWKAEESPSGKMESTSCHSIQETTVVNDAGSPQYGLDAKCASNSKQSTTDIHSPVVCLSNAVDESKGVPQHNINKCPARPPLLAEDVRVDIPEQVSNACDGNDPQHTNKVKVFRLSKSHSVAGSLLCFSMEGRGDSNNKEKERKGRATGGSLKLSRIGSLPCHSELHTKEFKNTCKKPPRPPRSPLDNNSQSVMSGHMSSDAIVVLRGTSRRSRMERRRRHRPSSSNAYIWALIFTFFFALAMLGEGFWSLNSPLGAINSDINPNTESGDMNMDHGMPLVEKTPESGTSYVSSQLEKEMQMREFWISKGLDPS